MNLRRIAMTGMLLGSTFMSLSGFLNSAGNASPPDDEALSVRRSTLDEPLNRRNLNQQWPGWTLGRMLGVSIGPDTAPPPPMFEWK